jgi:protein ImuB
VPEPIEPIRPAHVVEVRRVFAEPIAAPETIHRYIGKLVGLLCAELEERGLGARRLLDLLFGRVDDRVEAVRVGTSTPTRDVKRLLRLLRDRIETVDPGFGIEVMRLAATLAEPLNPKQVISSLTEEPEADVAGLIDILVNHVGQDRVYRYAAVASDVQERAVARVAAASPEAGESWPVGWPRPARLLKPPEPIETVALLPDHPPVSFTWRGVRRRVRRADGPERVFGEWWKDDAELVAVRDYFQVEDDAGERFWIFRAGDGENSATGFAALVHSWDFRMSYYELQCTSHFSFLRGASSCEELFAHAASIGLKGLAVVDRNSLAGIVRAHEAAKVTSATIRTGLSAMPDSP